MWWNTCKKKKKQLDRISQVTLREITSQTVVKISNLSDTLSEQQRKMVAPNAISIAQAHFCDQAWFRAVYADDEPIGFVMLHDDEEKKAYFLWRFMIAAPYQGMGLGKEAMKLVIDYVKSRPGATELVTSYVPIEGGPAEFYRKLGFEPTGEVDEGEIVASLQFSRSTGQK